jgi:hypothetical protein
VIGAIDARRWDASARRWIPHSLLDDESRTVEYPI